MALLLTACAGPGYYAQAIGGHLELMRQRQPVAETLKDEAIADDVRRELQLSLEIREFAVSRLGLPDNGSYSRYVATGRDAVTWNVVAAPELSLEPRRWCFLFAGCVPYRGYFARDAAEWFADRLAADGLDVTVFPAQAYSTLGWFEDPLLDTMLRRGDAWLAGIMFHEFAHQRLYVKGDTAFNESYASFVEEIGVDLWLRSSGRADRLAAWRRQRAAARQFDARVLQTREALAALYAADRPAADQRRGKQAILDALRADYDGLVAGPWSGTDYFAGWFEAPLNNARLALFASYRGGVCAFAGLYAEAGEDMARFHELAGERARLPAPARQAWLRQRCPDVASGNEL
ncbi:MAG: aminopeptidase [Xanthomonadales bacterium]|nr:aminopeptidase [Xanthomonadales bacterium]